MSAFTKFVRHPATESSIPSTLRAQMPRQYVRAVRFDGSHQTPRQVPVHTLENWRAYNKAQNITDAMDFKPIYKEGQFVPSTTTDFSRNLRTLAPPSPLVEEEQYPTDIPDVGAIEADAMEGSGMKKMKKGSPAMKAHMAKLRAMRKKK